MKTLVLMRHAKSNWSGDLSDFDRPLNERGIKSARALGNWLRANNLLPDFTLVSAAQRTVETFDELKLNCPFEKKKKLYLAPLEEIFHQIRQVDANRLLLICHNPGISEFSQEILSEWPLSSQFESFPTCSTCIIDFNITDWSSLQFGTGEIKKFITPRDLGVF
jgi:phosphohistidine phosphatase